MGKTKVFPKLIVGLAVLSSVLLIASTDVLASSCRSKKNLCHRPSYTSIRFSFPALRAKLIFHGDNTLYYCSKGCFRKHGPKGCRLIRSSRRSYYKHCAKNFSRPHNWR